MARSKNSSEKHLNTGAGDPPRRSSSPSNGHGRHQSPPSDESDRPIGPLSVVVPPIDRDVVQVNRYNATELKNACDDAVKRYLSRPELFKQNHLHTDVRLGLGWLGVFVAAGTALYGYKVDFEQSKPAVTIGLIVYIVLTTIQTLYAYFVEGKTVFVGKRKTFSKRIISERITISTSTVSSPSPSSTPASSSSSTPSSSSSTLIPSKTNAPFYHITISYVRSTNGGKSLLAKGRVRGALPYSEWFDEKGVLDQEAFERWVGEQVELGMDGKSV